MRLLTRAWGVRGRPLAVLVHGGGDGWQSWTEVGGELAEDGFRAEAVELRLHGVTPEVESPSSLDDLADDVCETVESLVGPSGRTEMLVGHSLGALVAATAATRRPDLFARLVLEDPPGPLSFDYRARAPELRSELLLAREDPGARAKQLQTAEPWMDAHTAEAFAEANARCDAERLPVLVASLADVDTVALVRGVGIPTMLILGDERRGSVLTGSERAALVNANPLATVRSIDAGHLVHGEASEAFLAVIRAWLAPSSEGL